MRLHHATIDMSIDTPPGSPGDTMTERRPDRLTARPAAARTGAGTALALAAILAVAASSVAAALPPASYDVGACLNGSAHASSMPGRAIPDGTGAALTLGPLETGVSGRIDRVVLMISARHPNTGDLSWTLGYDADRDGRPDASSPVEIYLARPDPCQGEEAWACPIELDGTYYFEDEGWQAAGATASFEVFRGLPAGGDWYLTVEDRAPDQAGTVRGWSIFADVTPGAMGSRLGDAQRVTLGPRGTDAR
ncbi:MAG: hypothetical protein PVF43_03155 [Candidatus Eiseniibacteriota bacterium]|jgi:hypothetical protein